MPANENRLVVAATQAAGENVQSDLSTACAGYVAAGLALVPIPLGSKGPRQAGWNLLENCITAATDLSRIAGNVGLAHAYCTPFPTCAIDLDDLAQARAWLAENDIDIDALLDDPAAVRIVSGRANRAKLLYRLPCTLPSAKLHGLEFRCASADGKTVQDVLPPSIHPDTGKPYTLHGDIAAIPSIPPKLLALWVKIAAKEDAPAVDLGPVDAEALEVRWQVALQTSDALRRLCRGERLPWMKDASRSGFDFALAWTVAGLGFTDAEISALFDGFEHGKSWDRRGRQRSRYVLGILRKVRSRLGGEAPARAAVEVTEFTEAERPPARASAEMAWIVERAPQVLRDYVSWHQVNAIRPHPLFALVSGLLFAQAVIGGSRWLENGLRLNLWTLLLAPTESGKGAVLRLPQNALDQLKAAGIEAAVASLDEGFGSAEGLWWHLEKAGRVLWADEELAKTLAAVVSASEGTPRYAMRRALLRLYDAAGQATVAPIRYSQRARGANEMQALRHPFLSVIGTGVPRDIETFTAAAAEDGLLNRFLVLTVDDTPALGSLNAPTPLPTSVLDWAVAHVPLFGHAAAPLGMPPEVVAAWREAMDYGTARAQTQPGVWGRHAEKILKLAALHALFEGHEALTFGGFTWAQRLARWATEGFAEHFAREGGGGENELDRMASAFLSAFDAPSLAGRDVLPTKAFHQWGGRAWSRCRDSVARRKVVQTLIDDGLIEEVALKPKGVGYRRLR